MYIYIYDINYRSRNKTSLTYITYKFFVRWIGFHEFRNLLFKFDVKLNSYSPDVEAISK